MPAQLEFHTSNLGFYLLNSALMTSSVLIDISSMMKFIMVIAILVNWHISNPLLFSPLLILHLRSTKQA